MATVVATTGSIFEPYGTTIAVFVAVGVADANRMPLLAEVVAIIESRFEPYGTTIAVFVAVAVAVPVTVAVSVAVAVGVSDTNNIPLLAAAVAIIESTLEP